MNEPIKLICCGCESKKEDLDPDYTCKECGMEMNIDMEAYQLEIAQLKALILVIVESGSELYDWTIHATAYQSCADARRNWSTIVEKAKAIDYLSRLKG